MNIGMMATYPPRWDSLVECLPTICHQLDKIYIYCNGYEEKNIMELQHWVNHNLSCPVEILPADRLNGNIMDMGKFVPMSFVKGYIFLLDDDLLYPRDYVERHIRALNKHKGISTVHGRSITKKPLSNYFHDTKSYHYRQPLKYYREVSVAGTGTTAVHSSTLTSQFHTDANSLLIYQGMADIWFAKQARLSDIDIYCLPRTKKWLKDTRAVRDMKTLYEEAVQDTSIHCQILNKYWND